MSEQRLSEGDRDVLQRWPDQCAEGVERRGEFEPCDRTAVAVRFDPTEGGAYPVCRRHVRGEMASLADLLAAGEVNHAN